MIRPDRPFSLFAVLPLLLLGGFGAGFGPAASPAPDSVPAIDARLASRTTPGAAECSYDTARPPIENYQSLLSFSDPMMGNAKAKVTVIEFFEPNCPHCATLYPVMERLAQKHGKIARFYMKPLVYWPQQSLKQVQALHVAAQQGKYFEMLSRQMARQQRGGLSLDQLKTIAGEIGLDPGVMAERIETGMYTRDIQQQYQKAVVDHKINSVPAVLINGRFVSGESKTAECLDQLIRQAATGK